MTLSIALLVLAFVLVMAELAFPSLGFLTLCAAGAYAFSLVKAFEVGNTYGWSLVGAGVLLLPVAIILGLRVLPLTPMGKRLFLRAPDTDQIQRGTRDREEENLVDCAGRALTDLRPAGTAEVEGQRVDVVANGKFIPRGAAIKVVSVGGGRIVVETISGDSHS